MNQRADNELPVVCTLTATTLAQQSGELLPGLILIANETQELEDGYAFRFPSETEVIHQLLRTIQAERVCCQFLTFNLTFEPAQGPIWLRVTGPEGTKELLKSLLQPT